MDFPLPGLVVTWSPSHAGGDLLQWDRERVAGGEEGAEGRKRRPGTGGGGAHSPLIISGAIQYGLPTTVYRFLRSGFLRLRRSAGWVFSSTMSRASPKSATTTFLF